MASKIQVYFALDPRSTSGGMEEWVPERKEARGGSINELVPAVGSQGPVLLGSSGRAGFNILPQEQGGDVYSALSSVMVWGPEDRCLNSTAFLACSVCTVNILLQPERTVRQPRVPEQKNVDRHGLGFAHCHLLRITICIVNFPKSEIISTFTPGRYKDPEHFTSMYSPSPEIYRPLLLCILIPPCLSYIWY